MALYVYITKECEQDAKRFNRHSEMIRLKDKVETAQRICHFDNFPPPYLKKRFDRQIRLLANFGTVQIGDEVHLVVSFLRIFVRSSNEYESFLADTNGFGKKHLEPLASESDLEEYLRHQLKEHPLPLKSKPSDHENHFLYRFLGADQNRTAEAFVCESERWVRKVGEERIKTMLVPIFEALAKLTGSESTSTVERVRSFHIVYRWFSKLDKLFLAGIAETETEREELQRVYKDILDADTATLSEEQLLRSSMRTYPALLLAGDEHVWLDIQRDVESNLALSAEETQVLESVHSSDQGFPIFINGRAGSGKSTVLYYLFADYVSLYLELIAADVSVHPPLLLSCSDELRSRAQKSVENLISHNPRWRSEDAPPANVPQECFKEFRKFLLELVTELERETLFPDNKYVGFAQFRRLWQTHFGRDRKMRQIGPDISWHIIRSYIKGTDSEDYLDSEEYEHVPRRQKSVSMETFNTVFQNVWEGWYRELCEQDGYWDDQDLARFIFEEDRVDSRFPAVFCDEAQDFTRVELDLLFRLCLFTDRELTHADLSRVPFAFAGDPFQTLNPTGFRWDSVQAMFHEKLIDSLGRNVYRNLELNYQELNLNYRSTMNVVRLCNLIQGLRAALFELPDLQPQKTWQTEENSPMPVWFDRHKVSDWNQLGNEKDVTIIIPCMLNEEQEWVQADKELSQVVQMDERGFPVNVLSPTRAKGLEFNRVALYAFADCAPDYLLELLDKDNLDRDTLLPLEYLVNQLYVAASRPKRRLFIIDTQSGREKLWRLATDEKLQEKLWRRIPEARDVWKESIGGLIPGNADSWNEERGNPEENAERFMQQGLSNRDVFMLRSAAALYDSMGKSVKANTCMGHACKFEERPREAGEFFQKAGESYEALTCFWQSGISAKQPILDLHKPFPDIGMRIEYQMMAVYHERLRVNILKILEEVARRVREEKGFARRMTTERTFLAIIREYAKEFYVGDANAMETAQFIAHCEEIQGTGVPVPYDALAELNYSLGEIDKAMICWEKTETYGANPNYRKAKNAKLAKAFEADNRMHLSPTERKMLSDFFLEQKKYLEAARICSKELSIDDLLNVLDKITWQYEEWERLFEIAVDALVRAGDWQQVLDLALASIGLGGRSPRRALAVVAKKRTVELRNSIVRACANSDDFAKLGTNLLKRYSDYFKHVFASPKLWKSDLAVQVAGAAIERAGRQVDVLEFYESVMAENDFALRAIDFARERWIATKEKQAKRESEQGNEKASIRHMREADEKRRTYGLVDKVLPDLPTPDFSAKPELVSKTAKSHPVPPPRAVRPHVDPKPDSSPKLSNVGADDRDRVDEDRTVSEPVIFELQSLRFEFSPNRGRLNITHTDTLATASVLSGSSMFQSLDVTVSRDLDKFICADWRCECGFQTDNGYIVASLGFLDLSLSLQFKFPERATVPTPK